jgi:Trypsin-like peptidase domain
MAHSPDGRAAGLRAESFVDPREKFALVLRGLESEPPGGGDPSAEHLDSRASRPDARVRKSNLRWVALGVVVIVLVSSIAYFRFLTPPPLTTKQVIALVQPSVVTVKVTVFRSDAVEASGFVYRKRGHILTNAHAVARALTIEVVDASGASHRAYLVGVDRVRDVAELVAYDMVLGVPKAQPLRAESRPVAVGAKVLVIGNPFGALPNTVTNGLVRGTGRRLTDGSNTYDNLLETDAVFNPKNIGGPMVDSAGDLVGMATIGGSGNVFAIPVAGFEPDAKTWTQQDITIALGPPLVTASAKSLVLGGVGPGFQLETSYPWSSTGYHVFFRKSRTNVSGEEGISIYLAVDGSENGAIQDYQFYSDESTQRGYANLGTKLGLGDQASAGTTSGISNWGVNHRVVWRDRNVVVLLLWDAVYSSDVSITDVLNLAGVQASVIGANLTSYQ